MGDTHIGHAGLRALPGPGTEIGAYRILDLLGTGGMGQVFLAEHKKLGRRVALKLLLPEWAGNPEVISRFFHEAKAVNQINHQHIVEIVDFVEEPGGFNYFIMELLDGRDLAMARDKDGPFAIERTVFIQKQMLSALNATHAKGIVHRDLKPENIFLIQRDGNADFVKLLDFGIAKLSNRDADDLNDQRPRTRAGMILGTPEYMSPEQAGGQSVDQRSDIYSVGVILYWMLSDQLPYRGRSVGELLAKQLTTSPGPLPDVAPSGEVIPADLAELTYRCLSREPQRRPTSTELINGLSMVEVKPVLLQRPKRKEIWPAILIGVLLLAVAGYGIFRYGRATPASELITQLPPPLAPAPPPKPAPEAALPAAPPVPLAPVQAAAPAHAVPAPTIPASEAKPPPAPSEGRPKVVPPRRAKVKAKAKESDDSNGMLDPFANP
jgi:serine/threonine protein kinase